MPERVTPPDPRPGDEKTLPLKNIVEAILFVTPQPLPLKNLCALIGSPTQAEVLESIRELQRDYVGKGVELAQVAGGFRFFSREEYAPWAKKVLPEEGPSRLSRAALEAISVIAYRQPITRVLIEEIRGVNCDGVLRSLLDRKLITTEGREDAPGRPFRYRTTKHFLLYFGLSSLEDLPPLPEGQAEEMDKRAAAVESKEAAAAEAADESAEGAVVAESETAGTGEPEAAGEGPTPEVAAATVSEGVEGGETPALETAPGVTEVAVTPKGESAEAAAVTVGNAPTDFKALESDLTAAPSEAEEETPAETPEGGNAEGVVDEKPAPEE